MPRNPYYDEYARARAEALLAMQDSYWVLGYERPVIIDYEKVLSDKWYRTMITKPIVKPMFGVDLGHGAFLRDDGDIMAPEKPVPRDQIRCDGLMTILGSGPQEDRLRMLFICEDITEALKQLSVPFPTP